jgi:chemotaxis protein methyltransferase CheR
MTTTLYDIERFRSVLTLRTGLFFDETRFALLQEVLERRLALFPGDATAYFAELEGRPATPEVLALAEELTVGETYFFRHLDQLRAYSEVALAERQLAGRGSRPLKVLSAGASSGEEAYSLAILASERGFEAGRSIEVEGIDLNPRAVERAQRGRYTAWSLRETTEDVRRRWFRQVGREYEVAANVKAAVRFRQGNLATTEYPANELDVIFCRNVLMYFSPEKMRDVVARLTLGLAPGGYLFLGHAETLRGLSLDYHLCHTHNTFYYRKKHAQERAPRPYSGPSGSETQAAATPDEPTSTEEPWASGNWLDTIQRTANRIQALAEGPGRHEPSPLAPPPASSRRQHVRALELLSRERFADALTELGEPSENQAADADTLLLRAVLLTHSGQLDAAETTCTQLLELDELSAGAHYLLALCHERKDRLDAALEHDQTAIYLDPTLAMPRLHLGLIARRIGDRHTARRELTQAALLLEREDASHLLMYGGGFGRNGLIALCRSELGRLGDST